MNGNDSADPMDIDESFSSNVISPAPSEMQEARRASETAIHEKARATESAISDPQSSNKVPAHVDLDSLSHVAPFQPSNTGLGDLKDLITTLPFESQTSRSRPSQTMTNGVAFSSLKALNLPRPPKEVIPPLEDVTQDCWARYTSEMAVYMREWDAFNLKMLDHFRARQAQLDMSLKPNWMRALGDGPDVNEIYQKIQDDPDNGRNMKVGYAAYRHWMEEDERVREWWNLAFDRHMQAVIELGKVREKAKPLAVV